MFAWFAETTVVAALLAAAAWLATKTGKFGPAARHVLWLVVLVKMVTPPVVKWPFAVDPATIPSARPESRPVHRELLDVPEIELSVTNSEPVHEDMEAANLQPQDDSFPHPEWECRLRRSASDGGSGFVVAEGRRSGKVGIPAQDRGHEWEQPVIGNRPGLMPPILLLWSILTAGFTTWQVGRILGFSRRLRGSKPIPEWLETLIDEVAAKMGVHPPRAVVSDGAGSPFLWCAGRPTLVVPKALLGHFDADQWEGILAHELAHLRRGDPWVCRIALAAGVLWWWNPLYWLVKNRLDTEAELACDAWAVWSRPTSRRQYAETLVDVCEFTSSARIPSPALGVGGAGKFLERRLIMILQGQETHRLRRGGMMLAAMLAIIATPSWTKAQDAPPKPDQPATPAAPAEAPKPPAAPKPETTTTTTSRAEATATADGVEVRVTTGEDGKPQVHVNRGVRVTTASADEPPPLAVSDAQAKVQRARQELLRSEVELRRAQEEVRKATEATKSTFTYNRAKPHSPAQRGKSGTSSERRVEVRIDKDGKVIAVVPEELKDLIGDKVDGAELGKALAKVQGLTAKAATPPAEIDALNRRMDSLEKKLDQLLDELKARPARPAPPATRARRPAGGRDVDEPEDDDETLPVRRAGARVNLPSKPF